MATRRADSTQQNEPAAPQECMPCEGRGAVISNLGGEQSSVQCPWCEGSGQRRPGIDAQAHWGDRPPDQVAEGEQPAAGS